MSKKKIKKAQKAIKKKLKAVDEKLQFLIDLTTKVDELMKEHGM